MKTIDKDNTGVAFDNNKQNDRQPDIKGQAKINGFLYNVSIWKNKSKSGLDYYSLAFNRVEISKGEDTKTTNAVDGLDDEIPF